MPTAAVLSWFEARMDRERVFAARAIATLRAPAGAPGMREVPDAAALPT
jgi:biopolymer transport protein ExbB